MTYELIVNSNKVYSGTLLDIFVIAIAVIVLISAVIVYTWRQYRKNSISKYEFITIIAHKFRTPLVSIKWLIETMRPNETDSYKKQSLEDIDISNQKLIDLTGTLIELTESANASKVSYKFERLSLYALVHNVADTLKNSLHEKNIFFSVKPPEKEIFVRADRIRLEFVVQTILENACIYTSPGKNVDVSISFLHNNAIVTVTDHGIGISQKDIPKIFSKFYRTTNAKSVDTEGFGVGLYLAQSIIKQHHGKIEVFSEGLDKGSTFSIILPKTK